MHRNDYSPPLRQVAGERFVQALLDSRTVIDRFACFVGPVPGDWRTAPRIDPNYEVHYCFLAPRASMHVMHEPAAFDAAPGSLLWFPPGVPYELRMRARRRRESLLRLRFRVLRGRASLSPFQRARCVPQALEAQELIRRCHGEDIEAGVGPRLRCLLGLLADEAVRHGDAELEATRLTPRQLRRLSDMLLDDPGSRPRPADLAHALGYAPGYFTRLFSASVGRSPRRWLVEERIRYAAERLGDSDRPITAIAEEFGYQSPFLFSRQFRDVMGVSPRSYRRRGAI